ncbi:MAG: hypothetical protein AB8B74_13425 [Crocinitomicaceae bacterium]
MKNLVVSMMAVLVMTQIAAQNINYTVVKNQPVEPRISVNLDLFNLDMNSDIDNLRIDNISLNVGLFGFVKIAGPLEVDFNVHKSIFTAGKLGYKNYPGNTELNGGINFWLTNREKTKNTKVVLASDKSTRNGKEITTTTYITVPALHQKRIGIRGGLYSKTGPFNFKDYAGDLNNEGIDQTKIASYGIYGGFNLRRIINIVIKDDIYGRSVNSSGRDIYLDAIIVPINRFKDLNNEGENVSELVRGLKTTSPIGFRLGYKTYQVEKKGFTGKKFGICGIGEFGYKPYQGWFLTAGFGITLVKQSK